MKIKQWYLINSGLLIFLSLAWLAVFPTRFMCKVFSISLFNFFISVLVAFEPMIEQYLYRSYDNRKSSKLGKFNWYVVAPLMINSMVIAVAILGVMLFVL